jgi:hypothetical protein
MRPDPFERAEITEGLPPGTTIEIPIEIVALSLTSVSPGGGLGGEVAAFDGQIRLPMTGTGELAGFSRNIVMPSSGEVESGPRSPTSAVQSFETDLTQLQGEIFGDPDFDMLRITSGNAFGMPSPGHTTLTRLPSGQWTVDSFFDITYRIEFVGAPGGPLQGMSGSTTGTIRVYQGCPNWLEGDPAKMHYPQLPDPFGWDVYVPFPYEMADDFECTESGPIKDIHFWGSWHNGIPGRIRAFHLKIYSDVPAGVDALYSHPGILLWEGVFPDFAITPIKPGSLQGWYDPAAGTVLPDNHDEYWQYDFSFEQGQWFEQEAGTIYWLSVSADVEDGASPSSWGWKSSTAHFNDDAVYLPPVLPGTCTPSDNGTGTATVPAECPFGSEDVMVISDGLPPGTTIECRPTMQVSDVTEAPGGGMDGSTSQWACLLTLQMTGTGELAGFSRVLSFPPGPCVSDNGPRSPGDPVQDFPTEMVQLQLQLPPGDPDFDLLRVTGGRDFLMPSPGHTTLTRLGPPGSSFNVDSFFDITYRIDFVGSPGSVLGGMSGSTTATIRVQQGSTPVQPLWVDLYEPPNFAISMDLAFVITNGPGSLTGACCGPNGNCYVATNVNCVAQGGTYLGDGTPCLGDFDGDGVDDACGSTVLTGACCGPNGNCFTATSADCMAQGGTYLGDGSVCLGDNNGDGIDDACGSAVLSGACCLQDGTCVVVQESHCLAVGGTYLGDNSVCLGDADNDGADDACEAPAKKGACCWPDGGCSVTTAANCVQNGGTYQGDNTACLGDADGNGVDDACETPDPDFKWEQLPDIDPTGFDVNATYSNNEPYILADDFQCTVTGPITRIHVYASWFADRLPPGGPTDVRFILSIHEDIPATPDTYSRPGPLLCLLNDLPFEAKPYATDLHEGWLNPPDDLHPVGDKVCWEYTFFIPPDLCIQQGTPSNPIVYWLDLQAYPTAHLDGTPDSKFGWKSTLQHWNDDATWAWGQDNPSAVLDWQEMIYPPNHPMGGQSVDLAFKIIGSSGTPTPTGACCWPDGSCSVVTEADCHHSPNGVPGTYQGDGTTCLGDANANGVDDGCETDLESGACCYIDAVGGPQCTNTTEAECLGQLGGTWYVGQDCSDPNFKCFDMPPQGACCYIDAAGVVGCVTTTQGICVQQYGGTWYLGQDCTTIDCPDPQPMGACCYGPPNSPSCVNTTEDLCKAIYNGQWYPGQDCSSFDCPQIVQSGACCYDDPATGPGCINTTKKNCIKVYGGTWYPGQDCSTVDCPTQEPTGACCYGDPASPSCINTTQSDCLTLYGGTWYLGQDCANFECPAPHELGACCFQDPTGLACVDGVTQVTCEAQFGGNWYAGQTCATIDCPSHEDLGACCYEIPGATSGCVNTTQADCLHNYGGTWYAGQDCASFDCPTLVPTGACCYGDPASPSCVDATQADCHAKYGGTWYAGQSCTTFECPVPQETGVCCFPTAIGYGCANTTQLECHSAYGGSWYAGQDCATFQCPSPVPTGVCCFGTPPQCVTTSEDQCKSAYGGSWYAGQSCATFLCPLSCCEGQVGDANGSGNADPTIGDISIMIDAKFITGVCDGKIPCLEEADINQSADGDPTCDDITIGDISLLIDYLFITGPDAFGPLPDCR